jgi:predicted PurR-regulated permease PerM
MNEEKTNNIFTGFALVVAGVLVVVLGYSVNSVLSPFVLVGAIAFLLYPFRSNVFARRVLWLSIALLIVWFVYSLLGILAPVIFALVLAYVFNPVVSRLEKKRFPRWGASLLVTLSVLGFIVAVVLFVLPLALKQFDDLIGGIGGLAQNVVELLKSGKIFDVLAQLGIPAEQARDMITKELSPKLQGILAGLFSGLFGFVTGFSSVVLQIINAIIIPFLFFYLLKDLPQIKQSCIVLLPGSLKAKTTKTLDTVDEILGQYLRGAIIVALIQGTLSAIVLALIGVSYPLVLGIMTAVLNFIPYVGLLTSLIVSCIVALFSGEPVMAKVVGVVILYLSQKLLEATVLGPKIVGAKVGLHPVLLILSLMVFGYFLGFIGMLIAVPATALMAAFIREWQQTRTIVEQQPTSV